MNLKINKHMFLGGLNRYKCDMDSELKAKHFFIESPSGRIQSYFRRHLRKKKSLLI